MGVLYLLFPHGPQCALNAANGLAMYTCLFAVGGRAAFPDAADRTIPDIGYMPGQLAWAFGERLRALGVTIANDEPDASTHQDRRLLTGASPLAANALGRLAAETLLAEVGAG